MSLNHKYTRFNNDKSLILILDKGSVIDSEAEAMMQAMYSRSPDTVFNHLKIVEEKGAEKFMSTYYVEYGHASIGDCGDATIFIEGVSMLAAKAIQDTRLYSGQEVSTRYVDFSVQRFEDLKNDDGKILQEKLRSFYINSFPKLIAHLETLYPKGENDNENVWKKAIKAKAFDILRGFLPAGATTSVAWHTNLRQFRSHLITLIHHPLAEVRDIASTALSKLHETYPSSGFDKRYVTEDAYVDLYMQNYYFDKKLQDDDFKILYKNEDELKSYKHIFQNRLSRKDELPKFLENSFSAKWEFYLDFGSFRDIQRHRAVTSRMPLLSTEYGFEDWYLKSLPNELREGAVKVLEEVKGFVLSHADISKTDMQYYIPMGYKVPITITGGLHSLTYLAERRATTDVHETLRVKAVKLAASLQESLKDYGYVIHTPSTDIQFDIKRGSQDIIKKNN